MRELFDLCEQIVRTCYVELKQSARALVKYRHSSSTHGKYYGLCRVNLVNYLQPKPTHEQISFEVEFSNSDTLVFYCASRT